VKARTHLVPGPQADAEALQAQSRAR